LQLFANIFRLQQRLMRQYRILHRSFSDALFKRGRLPLIIILCTYAAQFAGKRLVRDDEPSDFAGEFRISPAPVTDVGAGRFVALQNSKINFRIIPNHCFNAVDHQAQIFIYQFKYDRVHIFVVKFIFHMQICYSILAAPVDAKRKNKLEKKRRKNEDGDTQRRG
ncbi:hypothetical protein T09_5964, partial [Trichinella sp. T9]